MSAEPPFKSFTQLLHEELQARGEAPVIKVFPGGETIFKEGDPGDGLYLILDGLVQISAIVGQSERRVLSQLGPGEFFGEMAVIDNAPRSASAIADKDSRLLFVSHDEMMELMQQCPALAVALLRDFSHRMREFNRQYVQEILHADRLTMLGRFARSIVHDLKNPLNVIGLAGDMAAMEKATPEMRREARKRIHQQVDRLARMVNELLRVTEGTKQSSLEPGDFAAYFHSVVEEVREELGDRLVVLEIQNPPPAVTLRLNPSRLHHVFFNLFNNAADFMPRGGRIMVRFQQTPRELIAEVEDTGPGFSAETARKLFTPFFTQGKPNGTGLGLSICKNIIEDHGGKIAARREEGRGAIFSISLPVPD
ncbi:hypothetical protein LBMAG56_13630 [Verrucomicrobiota bacterium]|nr:hypothetical protein LBMAG56_13630 [Verrucomicrobiota bacterium]